MDIILDIVINQIRRNRTDQWLLIIMLGIALLYFLSNYLVSHFSLTQVGLFLMVTGLAFGALLSILLYVWALSRGKVVWRYSIWGIGIGLLIFILGLFFIIWNSFNLSILEMSFT